MKIFLAKNAGYCFGVRDAVQLAYDTAQDDGDVYMLGHIVHNENVVEKLDKAGARLLKRSIKFQMANQYCFALMELMLILGKKPKKKT